MQSFNAAFQTAAALGVTICCATGDNGSGDMRPPDVADGKPHVDFPGSSPLSLCCGGTRLVASGGEISRETVWNDDPVTSATGGCVSNFFRLPEYQMQEGVPPFGNSNLKFVGRGAVDVAGDADPAIGHFVREDGFKTVIGGTSAVATLWVGLIALMSQSLGKPVELLDHVIYACLGGTASFRDIVQRNNCAYSSTPGWYPRKGWGSPNESNT
jgi:kumamolisin